jgi:hypothetical protein
MTPREAAEQRLAKAFMAAVHLGSGAGGVVLECAKIAAEAIDAALDEHHCGCCDGGPWEQVDPWDAVLPQKEAVK